MPVHNNTDPAEAFRDDMTACLYDYERHLAATLTKATIAKHALLIGYFIEWLYLEHEVTDLMQISYPMCGHRLVRAFNTGCDQQLSLQTAKNILYRFFVFIADKKDILQWPLLAKLKK
ncbi:hypothetical protein ACTHGU_08405 [Chitinophagaceae bacterium MMS25-I14]